MRTLRTAVSVLVGVLGMCLMAGSSVGGAEEKEEGFVRLGNGKDMSDFALVGTPESTWKVEDGVIKCSGSPFGYFATTRSYRNFVLRFDLKYARPDGLKDDSQFVGNSGVLLHITGEHDVWPRRFIEVQGMNADLGRIFAAGEGKPRELKVKLDHEARARAVKLVGEWNSLEVVSRDGAVKVFLNGAKVCESEGDDLQEGPIGFQSEGVEIHFRNLRIREENAVPNSLSQAERDAGWRLLFDGQTTNGWRTYKGQGVAPSWKVVDGSLVSAPKQGEATGDLMSVDAFDDFELVLDWKMVAGGNSGVMYRVTEDKPNPWDSGLEYQILDNAGHLDGQNPLSSAAACYAIYGPAKDVTKPLGQWNRSRIVARGYDIEHWLNDERVVAFRIGSPSWAAHLKTSKFYLEFYNNTQFARASKGHFCLQDYGNGIEFRNLKVRPLPPANQSTEENR